MSLLQKKSSQGQREDISVSSVFAHIHRRIYLLCVILVLGGSSGTHHHWQPQKKSLSKQQRGGNRTCPIHVYYSSPPIDDKPEMCLRLWVINLSPSPRMCALACSIETSQHPVGAGGCCCHGHAREGQPDGRAEKAAQSHPELCTAAGAESLPQFRTAFPLHSSTWKIWHAFLGNEVNEHECLF